MKKQENKTNKIDTLVFSIANTQFDQFNMKTECANTGVCVKKRFMFILLFINTT